METRYKISVIGLIIIAVILFLQAPSIMGQPECNDQIIHRDYDCRLWSNWDWIEFELLHCWELNLGKTVWPSAYQSMGCA